MQTVPNQRVIIIHREKCEQNFLQIKKENLINAYKTLKSYAALYLYLCLAGNKDKYEFSYSPQAIANQFEMPISTAKDQFNKLVECGYLVQKKDGSNIYDFYETPQTVELKEEVKQEVKTAGKIEFKF